MHEVYFGPKGLNIEVIVNAQGYYRITWQGEKNLRVIASFDPVKITETGAETFVGKNQIEISIKEPRAAYFHIYSENRKLTVISNRRVALQGASNFRDLGGYIGDSGRQVCWGKLFRSGQLAALSNKDEAFWQSLQIGTIFDLRSPTERAKSPSQIPGQVLPNIAHLEIGAGNTTQVIKDLQEDKVDPQSLTTLMIEINRHFVLNQSSTFRTFLSLLCTNKSKAVLFHCTAGKDRTGFATALLLSILGVNYDQVMADYLLSNRYLVLEELFSAVCEHYTFTGELNTIRPLLEVRSTYLNAAFDAINEEYGCIENYFSQAVGLTTSMRHALQAQYLQDE